MRLRPATALILLLSACCAHAQSGQTVVTTARPLGVPRDDVRAACPELADTLQRELAGAVLMHAQPGTVRVEFSVREGRVDGVLARGGPAVYRQPIRRALLGEACAIGPGADRFRLAVRLQPQPADAPPHQLAQLLMP